MVLNATPSEAANYTCVAENSFFTRKSEPIQIHVAEWSEYSEFNHDCGEFLELARGIVRSPDAQIHCDENTAEQIFTKSKQRTCLNENPNLPLPPNCSNQDQFYVQNCYKKEEIISRICSPGSLEGIRGILNIQAPRERYRENDRQIDELKIPEHYFSTEDIIAQPTGATELQTLPIETRTFTFHPDNKSSKNMSKNMTTNIGPTEPQKFKFSLKSIKNLYQSENAIVLYIISALIITVFMFLTACCYCWYSRKKRPKKDKYGSSSNTITNKLLENTSSPNFEYHTARGSNVMPINVLNATNEAIIGHHNQNLNGMRGPVGSQVVNLDPQPQYKNHGNFLSNTNFNQSYNIHDPSNSFSNLGQQNGNFHIFLPNQNGNQNGTTQKVHHVPNVPMVPNPIPNPNLPGPPALPQMGITTGLSTTQRQNYQNSTTVNCNSILQDNSSYSNHFEKPLLHDSSGSNLNRSLNRDSSGAGGPTFNYFNLEPGVKCQGDV